MADDYISPAFKARMAFGPDPQFSPLGGPYPEPMVELSDGSTVPERIFGSPPADLPPDQWDEWYANRDEQLVTERMQ